MLEMETIRSRSLVSLRIARQAASVAAEQWPLADPLTHLNSDLSSIWLGPDHWLLMSDTLAPDNIIALCNQRLAGKTSNATNASDAFEILSLQGKHVRELLSSGCGLDFRERSFKAGSNKRTRLAQIQVLICARDDGRFELVFDQSYGAYLSAWITDSASLLLEMN